MRSCTTFLSNVLYLRYETVDDDEGPLGRAMAQAVSRRPAFNPRSVHVWSVLGKVAMGQVSIREFHLSSASIIPPVLHTRLQLGLHVAVTRSTNCESLAPSKSNVFRKSGNIGQKNTATFWRITPCRLLCKMILNSRELKWKRTNVQDYWQV
jgi:hypothetical protein